MNISSDDIERLSEMKGWKNLSNESWREYEYIKLFSVDSPHIAVAVGFHNRDVPKKVVVRIIDPVALLIRESGSHLVVCALGVTHYVPPGWHALRWRASNYADF